MRKHLTTLVALTAALSVPQFAMAQDAEPLINAADIFGSSAETTPAPAADEASADASEDTSSSDSSSDSASAQETSTASDSSAAAANDSKSDDSDAVAKNNGDNKAKSDSDDDDDDDDEKSWSVGAKASFDIGLGAFTKHEYARRIRSRFAFEINGSYTIPVIDVDIHAETGFSQWMSKAGGSNGQYEFRWADSAIGLSRNIWSYKDGGFAVSFDADLSFALPTSKASIQSKLYTTIAPTLAASIKFHKLAFSYSITYGHNFNKYTSMTYDPSEVDVLSRSTGVELLGAHTIATGGVLTEIELVNQFAVGYQFIKQFGMNIGLGFGDGWTYDNGTISKDDGFVSPYAKVGRGHSQYSLGTVSLVYVPIKYLALSLTMASMQPWKTADNKTLRFPWFDTVSPSKNFTKFILGATFNY